MNEELSRIKTFLNWPSTANFSPLTLARCGFIYTGPGDRVECYQCRCQLENWRRGDNVDTRHRQINIECLVGFGIDRLNAVPAAVTVEQPAVRSRQVVVVVVVEDDVRTGNGNQQQQQRHQRPSDAELQQLRRHLVRLSTFHDWFKVPASRFIGADELARAGFYYTGHGDAVRCAFCHGGLQDWKDGDDAITGHQRLNRHCPFVRKNFCQLTPPAAAAAAAAGRPATNQQPVDVQRLRAENAQLVEERTCKYCLDSSLEVIAFIPCGHVSCRSCSVRFYNCPNCREFISGLIPLRLTTKDRREHRLVAQNSNNNSRAT